MNDIETVREFFKRLPHISMSGLETAEAALDRIAEALADAEKALAELLEASKHQPIHMEINKNAHTTLTKLRSLTNEQA